MRWLNFLAGCADLVAVFTHGLLGYRWAKRQLLPGRLAASAEFGDADMSWRIFAVTWHAVTAAFLTSALASLAVAGGLIAGGVSRFIAVMHGSFLLVGVAFVAARLPEAMRRPIPIVFASCMTAVTILAWVGAA
jgi:hypothetical protein